MRVSVINKMFPNKWWSCCLWLVGTYIFAANLLPNFLLIVVSCSGYLPYSDRPGPGWQRPHLPTAAELYFFTGFARFFLKATILYGLAFAAVGLVLGFCRVPRWMIRVVVVPTALIASGLMMAAAGWMIAVSPLGIYIAAGCGAIWGLIVFPRLVPRTSYIPPIFVRLVLPTIIVGGGIYWLINPLLPDLALTNAKIEVIRKDAAGTDISHVDPSYIGSSIIQEADGVGTYASVSRMEFTTDGRNQSRVLLVIDDGRPVEHTFPLPRTGDAIYQQSEGAWKLERQAGRDSELSLRLSPEGKSGVSLEIKGPCCSSMTQTFGPYR